MLLCCFLDCELGDLKDVTDDLKEDKNTHTAALKQASGQKQTQFLKSDQDIKDLPLKAGGRVTQCVCVCVECMLFYVYIVSALISLHINDSSKGK